MDLLNVSEVAPFHRIIHWLGLEGTSGGLLGQSPPQSKADFKLRSGCSVRALLGQAVWSLRMEMTQSIWATCCTCSCSTPPSIQEEFPCCNLWMLPLEFSPYASGLHLFCNSLLAVIQLFQSCVGKFEFGYVYSRRCTSHNICFNEV